MADAAILKEFLVSLGFRLDESSAKKLNGFLKDGALFALRFGTAFATAATAVEIFVDRVSGEMEDLYWASQRLRSSVSSIQAYEFAISNLGGSGKAARASLEGLASFMRSNPAGESFIRGLGVATRGVGGEQRGAAEIASDLAGKLKAMPFYRAKLYAQFLGIDEQTLMAMERGMDPFQAKLKAMYRVAGLDADKAAEASHRFQNRMRELGAWFMIAAEILLTRLLPVASKVVGWIEKGVVWLVKIDKATDGWSTRIGVLTLALGTLMLAVGPVGAALAVVAAVMASDWGKFSPQIKAIAADFADMANSINKLIKSLGIELPTSAKSGFGILSDWIDHILREIRYLADAMVAVTHGRWKEAGQAALKAFQESPVGALLGLSTDKATGKAAGAGAASVAPPSGSPGDPRGLRQNNPGNLRAWGANPIVGGFASFSSMGAGLNAMAGNLLAYRRRGLDTIAAIISRWAPGSENNTGAYIADVAKKLGVSAAQHLNLLDPSTLASLMGAMISHEQGRNPFGQDVLLGAANARLGHAMISQKTDIHIHGSSDPHATGRAVAGHQGRVNGDMVRNLKSALV